MKISKNIEKIIRSEFRTLKEQILSNRKEELALVKASCPVLLNLLKKRWDYEEEDLIDDVRFESVGSLISELRNGGEI